MNIRLYNEDCIIKMEKLIMDNAQVELILTSPPYYNVKDYIYYETYEDYFEYAKERIDL